MKGCTAVVIVELTVPALTFPDTVNEVSVPKDVIFGCAGTITGLPWRWYPDSMANVSAFRRRL
jgi:hypothetical protein